MGCRNTEEVCPVTAGHEHAEGALVSSPLEGGNRDAERGRKRMAEVGNPVEDGIEGREPGPSTGKGHCELPDGNFDVVKAGLGDDVELDIFGNKFGDLKLLRLDLDSVTGRFPRRRSSTSPTSTTKMKLFCWIIEKSSSPFPVKVENNDTVGDLKKAIMEEKPITLAGLEADQLTVWMVSIEETKDLKNEVSKYPLVDEDIPLASDKLSVCFPNPVEGYLHVVVQTPFVHTIKRQRPDSPLDTDGDRKKRQKQLPRVSNEELRLMKKLSEKIQIISKEPTKYSDPNEVFNLPFPSVNKIPRRFSLLDQRKFSYMGRECFSQVWKTFGIVESQPDQRQAVYLYGGKGYGKSYILAALACLLIRRGTLVVYLPDCLAWLFDPLRYLRNALVFAFLNCQLSCEEILDCENPESLVNFCAGYPNQLCFIVDQLNALDPEPMGQDVVTDEKKMLFRDQLQLMSANHILVTSASANEKTFQHMGQRDAGEVKVPLMGGMTSFEMSSWWKHHDFAAFRNEDKQRVEDLTGCNPLLLNPFLVHREKTLESLEPQIWEHEVFLSVRNQTIDFAKAKKDQLQRTTYVRSTSSVRSFLALCRFRDEFVGLMRKCLLGVHIAGVGPHMDHRYFYIDSESSGRYSCGLARQAITEFLRMNAEESIFLGAEWYDTLIAFKNNPSVTSFIVEQIVISKLASAGLRLEKFDIPSAPIFAFDTLTARLSIDKQFTYYVPVRFNQKAFDLLFASIDLKKKTAHIVPIQITIAKEHKDSEAAFFADKATWLRGLENFEVKITFLWIHHGKRGRYEVEQKLRELRSGTYEINPDYEVLWASIEEIDVELEKTLSKK